MTARYRPRRLSLRDGREVTLRAIVAADAREIVQAFERLSADSRHYRFMQHKKNLDVEALERSVHPQSGREFAFVAAVPSTDGIDIVGATQYVRANDSDSKTCEFAITVAEDWRGSGLAAKLLASLVRRARRDGYATMEGLVIADNAPMLVQALKLKFIVEPVTEDATVVRLQRTLGRKAPAAAASWPTSDGMVVSSSWPAPGQIDVELARKLLPVARAEHAWTAGIDATRSQRVRQPAHRQPLADRLRRNWLAARS